MRTLKQSTARNIALFMTDSSDHVTGKTGLSLTITASKDGAAFASISPTVTELATGWYKLALTSSHTDTLGDLAIHVTGTGADPSDTIMQVVAYDQGDAVAFGLSRLDAAITSRMATFTLPTNFSSLAITGGGAVTAGTVSDKTGYALTQTFPTNFSAMAITAGGAVTAGTVSDKTGYSLSQSFPTNFSALAITGGGAVTAGTVSDKTGYSLTQAFPTNFSSTSIDGSGRIDVGKLVGDATSASNLQNSTKAITTGTVGAASSTTSIVTSALSPAASVADQFKGKIVSFKADTTTVNLRGQSTDITASTAGGVLTVTALTTAPVNGDTFVIT